jgi:hypothetical protein
MTTLRNRLLLTASLPTGPGLASLYLASITHGHDATALFRLGITLLIAAVVLSRMAWISWDNKELTGAVIDLRREVRDLRHDHELFRQDVGARLAAKAWRQARTCDEVGEARFRVIHGNEEN